MEIDDAGRVVNERLARTITRSKARLVYDDVNALFAGSEQQLAAMETLKDTLRAMRTLAGKLRVRRQAQGCIDFEIDEPGFVLDDKGEPVEIMTPRTRRSEDVEDFMRSENVSLALPREKPRAAAVSRPRKA